MLTAGKSTEVGFISCPDMEFLARGWGVGGGGGLVLPYIATGMCRPIEYGFCAVLLWNRVWFSRELRSV